MRGNTNGRGNLGKRRTPEQRASGVPAFLRDFMPLFTAGKIHPVIDSTFPLTKLEEAKARMEANRHAGKIIVKID